MPSCVSPLSHEFAEWPQLGSLLSWGDTQLGICMIITGRGKHWNYLASHGGLGLLLRQWWGRDKWGGGNFLILIKSVCLFQ